jgi:chromosome segregation ATPase
LHEELDELRRDNTSGTPKNDRRIQQLNEKLAERERIIANYEKEITEAKWEVKRMGEIYSDLVIQNRQLQQERKEHLRCLEEARASLEKYKKREEEHSIETSMKEMSSDDSLGGELSSSYVHDPVPAPDLNQATSAQTSKNREDFFHLVSRIFPFA